MQARTGAYCSHGSVSDTADHPDEDWTKVLSGRESMDVSTIILLKSWGVPVLCARGWDVVCWHYNILHRQYHIDDIVVHPASCFILVNIPSKNM